MRRGKEMEVVVGGGGGGGGDEKFKGTDKNKIGKYELSRPYMITPVLLVAIKNTLTEKPGHGGKEQASGATTTDSILPPHRGGLDRTTCRLLS